MNSEAGPKGEGQDARSQIEVPRRKRHPLVVGNLGVDLARALVDLQRPGGVLCRNMQLQ